MLKNSKIIKLFICFFALLIINSFFIFRNPWVDWDIVSYIGNVKYIENKNIEIIHKETYNELREYLDQKRYDIIKQANQYRKDIFKDKEAFYDIMPFYNIKFIYIYSIYFLSKTGLSIINSILAISIFSYLIFSSILFFVFKKEIEKQTLLFFPLYLLTFSSPIIIAARSTTPDMFGAMLLFLGVFLVLKKQLIGGIAILIFSLGVRTDNIIFIGVLLFYLKAFGYNEYKINFKTFFIGSILTIGFYKGINSYFDNFGYWKLYYNSFIKAIPYPSSFEAIITLREYLSIFKEKIALLLGLRDNKPITFFPFYIILAMITFILAMKNKVKLNNIYVGLLLISTFTLIFKFAIFPNIQERYFISYFIIIFISLLKIAFNEENNDGRRRLKI
ncbi:MAG: hypothetical protein PHE25_02020 [Candidatus Gracilibacteria bacterium]|nr:hypothetical protein [Candidatus Gracilibacteria bacterium]